LQLELSFIPGMEGKFFFRSKCGWSLHFNHAQDRAEMSLPRASTTSALSFKLQRWFQYS